MMDCQNRRKSLRGNPYNNGQPKAIERQYRSPANRFSSLSVDQQLLHIHPIPRQQLAGMRPVCCVCKKDINNSNIYTSDCHCRGNKIFLCPKCYMINDERQIINKCDGCSKILIKTEFRQMDTRMEMVPPKCDVCDQIIKLSYMLPCGHKMCKGCFIYKRKMVISVIVDERITDRNVLCCGKQDCNVLIAIQQVHMISHGTQRDIRDALACTSCGRRLEQNCKELKCGHFQCPLCRNYCNLCFQSSSDYVREVNMSMVNIQEKTTKELSCDDDSYIFNMDDDQNLRECFKHRYKRRLSLHCGQHLCLGCMETMSDNTVNFKTSKTGVLKEFCICPYWYHHNKHIVPLDILRKAAAQIKYLTSAVGVCSATGCANASTVIFRDCWHQFCLEHVKDLVDNEAIHTTRNEKIHDDRRFCPCIYSCKIAVPVDELKQYAPTQGEQKDTSRPSDKHGDYLANCSSSKTYSVANKIITDRSDINYIDAKSDEEGACVEITHSTARTGNTSNKSDVTEKDQQDTGPHVNKEMELSNSCPANNSSVTVSETDNMDTDTLDVKPAARVKDNIPQTGNINIVQGTCDNPGCKAIWNIRKTIHHIFDCKHILCAQCLSELKTHDDDVLYCRVAKCKSLQKIEDTKEVLGIPNVGLTCYANCILQVLGQTPAFCEYLDRFCQSKSEDHVESLLNNLLRKINLGGDVQCTINWNLIDKLMTRMFRIDRSFRRYEENDCHLFIMSLLNALRKEEEATRTNDIHSFGKTRNQSRTHKFSEKMNHNIKEQGQLCPSVLFESRLVSKFSYDPCKHEETTDDQLFQSILIPVQNDLQTLEDGFQKFFQAEEFQEDVLSCRVCNIPQNTRKTTRTLQFAKAPDVLMLQLARFEEVDHGKRYYKELRKTDHVVMFGKNLKLIPEFSTDGRELEYELYGVVLHSGSMHGGHYTSCVRNLKSKKWYYCSDSFVREISEEVVFEKSHLKNAYVLFYTKK